MDRASTLERGYEKCAPELGTSLEKVRRAFISKTRAKRGSSHRGCECRLFVGDQRRKKVQKEGGTAKRKKRYANFHLPKFGPISAHRASYLLFRGGIPRGHEIHHDCLTDLCVEPKHLDALTPEDHAEREGRRRTARRPAPSPTPDNYVGIPPKIRPKLREFARRAGIEEWMVETGLWAFVGEDEIAWLEGVFRNQNDRPAGLAYVGTWADVPDRMAGMAGACIRNYTDGALRSRADVMKEIKDGDYPTYTVLLVPDFGVGRLSGRRAQDLSELLISRAKNGKSTVVHIPSLDVLGKRHGVEVRELVEEKYRVLYGAATAQEKRTEMERARRFSAGVGLRADSIDPLIRAARSEAYRQARSDRRDLDFMTLRAFLDRAVNREAFVQGCEAAGIDQASAEKLVTEQRDRAAEASADDFADIEVVAKALLARIEEIPGRNPAAFSSKIRRLLAARSAPAK